MNVGIFTDNDFDKVNGVTTTLRTIAAHAPSDIRPRVYTCQRQAVSTADYYAAAAYGVGIPFYREMAMYLPPMRRLLDQVRRDRIDVLHLTTPGPMGLAALYIASRLRLPLIGSFHTDLAEYTRVLSRSRRLGDAMQAYLRWLYGRCAQVLVPSAATRDALIGDQLDPARIAIWRRGVSTGQFSPARRSAALRAQWGASDRRPVILYAGRVSREKGLDLLPALTERLRRSEVAHRLVVVGNGPMRHELSDRCTGAVFTGVLSHDDVAIAMASADVFVFPSRTDTAGNVVLEAQASGLPVLVTDRGGPQEQMADGVSGFVCHDLRAFARRASQLLTSPSRRYRMALDARRHVAARGWDEALAPLYRAYREAAPPQAASAPIGCGPILTAEPIA